LRAVVLLNLGITMNSPKWSSELLEIML
jgi:hypothetical protein